MTKSAIAKISTALSLGACAFLLALAATTASAAISHREEGRFTATEAPGGPFGPILTAAAVNQATGNVWALETNFGELGQGLVDEFDQNGTYAGVQITGAATPQGSFAFGLVASGLAVDNSLGVNSGDVYIADTEHGVVDRFTGSGEFVCQITGKTPASPEEEAHECNGAVGSKTPDGSITPAGLAVDATGNVYVADNGHAVIDEFAPNGGFLKQITDSHLSTEMASIALGAGGTLYVTNWHFFNEQEPSNVVEFDGTGAFVAEVEPAGATGVAVDPGTGHVYTSRALGGVTTIAERDPAGALLDVFASSQTPFPGITVSGATGKVYAAEALNFEGAGVVIFGAGEVIPDVTIAPATEVQEHSAVLHGHVDPDTAHGGGEVTECTFEFGTTTAYGQTASCTPAVPYGTATDVSTTIAVEPGVTYHFRLKAANAVGANESGDETFVSAGPPAIDSESSTARTTSATVRAQIRPLGFDTKCEVQYIDKATFEASGYASAKAQPCTPADLGSGTSDVEATATLDDLQLNTTYHFRFVATSSAGSVAGADETFATFGVKSFSMKVIDTNSQPYTQAGGHPYELVTTFELNTTSEGGAPTAVANVKDIETDLPAGLLGNPTATARCTRQQLNEFECPGDAQVGVLHVHFPNGEDKSNGLYNLVPPAGVPAEFGVRLNTVLNVYIDAHVRTGGDYGVTATSLRSTTGTGVKDVKVELWGVPSDPRHDPERRCPAGEGKQAPCSSNAPLVPFLTNPTACGKELTATLRVDAWQDPGAFVTAAASMPATTGCESLDFSPGFTAQPDTTTADAPSGLHVNIRTPQNENPIGLAEATVKGTTVTLPPGMSISPSAANGLGACSPDQIGIDNAAAPHCPDNSKIGTVEISTPLLSDQLTGSVFVAQQNHNPFGSLYAIYLTAQADGALVKLAGHVVPDPVTGQLSTTFDELPQLPFSEVRVTLFGGPKGALATPDSCGTYATQAILSPWSGTAPVSLTEPFPISAGCVSGFNPSFVAGTESPAAASYSPLVLSFSRADTDQEISGLSVSLPPGLLARTAGIPLCSDVDANAGTCPVASMVGQVSTAAGPGSEPLLLPGRAFLTGPYKGGPYGLAVEVPAIAGPFNLGTVVVRQSLHIDPLDAHVTAVSDPFPTILDGVPIRLRRVDVAINRPGFTLDPTNCTPMAIGATFASTGGLTASRSSRFQAAGCRELPFKPTFTASTEGKTSKANGASLTVRVAQRPGEANIRKVTLQLPIALPSRLSTLQKACTEAQFNANPAGCPEASNIGTAIAHTPILNVPLTGPAYLVSHGGAAFPDVEFLLQGEGVHIILDGKTDIKKGITYSRFETVPDAPITSFETTLPEGPHSILAANGNLCASTKTVTVTKRVTRRINGRLVRVPRRVRKLVAARLLAPTTIMGQNGAVFTQMTKIGVTKCSPAKAPRHRHVRHHRHKS